MVQKIGVAVVGVGFVGGQAHTSSFNKIEGSKLVALGARTKKRISALAEKYDVKYYLDYDKLLKDQKVDAVVLAVPTFLHFDMAMKAIKKGKHVLCEMPMAPTIGQVEELQRVAEKSGVILMPVLNFRFAPIYVKTKEIIESKKIGDPLALHFQEFISTKNLAEQWPVGSWAWNKEKSGGYPDFTLSVWSLDMIRWMFKSEIKDVEWKASYPKLEKFGGVLGYNTMGLIKLSNGIIGSLHYSASVNSSMNTSKLEVFGDNSNVLHSIGNKKIILHKSGQESKEWNLQVKGARVWGHRQLDTHFIECLIKKKSPKISVEDAIIAQRTAAKMVKNS
jgi:predicted dehydrogenase